MHFQVPMVVVMLVECIHQAMAVNICLVVLTCVPSLILLSNMLAI